MKRMMFAGLAACAICVSPAEAAPRMLTGEPAYANDEARKLVETMIEAHGGTEAWQSAEGLSFQFITKVIGNGSAPFWSVERTDLDTGHTLLSYPRWNATIGYDGEEVWSRNWPMPLPPGFFTGLTSSFITLPWLTQRSDAHIGIPRLAAMPGHEELYHIVQLTFDGQGPHIPGQYYELFIDRETMRLEGIGFNITHAGMAVAPTQPLGPNFHRFLEYVEVEGLVIPSYYITHGYNSANGGVVEAMHAVFDISLSEGVEPVEVERPEDAVLDETTMAWWSGN